MWRRYAAAACALLAGALAAALILRWVKQRRAGMLVVCVLVATCVALAVSAPTPAAARPVRQMEAVDILERQLQDLGTGSTTVAYQLASPANRRSTAAGADGGNHDAAAFDRMVRGGFAPMLAADDYLIVPVDETPTAASYDVLLFEDGAASSAYRFDLSTVREADDHASLGAFTLPPDSLYWRTDAARPLGEGETKALLGAVHSRRQRAVRTKCFGAQAGHPSVAHSFGEDDTHNLCCALGPESKAYADASGNPIGAAAERIDVLGDKSISNWSTCMGSNVCAAYASRHDDGTRALFATNRTLTKVATDVPSDPDCEAFAARLLTATPHATPGIHTRGDPDRCRAKARVRAGLLTRQRDVESWLEGGS